MPDTLFGYHTVTESGNRGYNVYASGDTGIIAEEKTSAAKFTNSRSNVPKTGEDNSMMLGLCLMGISVLGMAGTLLSGNNKRRKPSHVKNR